MICGVGNIEGDTAPDGQCQAWHWVEMFRMRCSALPDIALTAGCVHEHVRTFEICGKCTAAMAETIHWRCGLCYVGDSAHECIVEIISEEWLEKS